MSTTIIDAEELTREFVVYDGGGLRRTRRVVRAVDGLTLRVEPGEAVGYIGANGSGKSTTIKMVSGILTPTSGSVRTCGLRPVPDRRVLARRIGVVFGQRSALWWDLPLEESFPILAAMHRMPRAVWLRRFDVLADELDLSSFLARPVRTLSLGQRMRGEVAAALLHSPALAVLDEPTIGLDMISKENLRRFLARCHAYFSRSRQRPRPRDRIRIAIAPGFLAPGGKGERVHQAAISAPKTSR